MQNARSLFQILTKICYYEILTRFDQQKYFVAPSPPADRIKAKTQKYLALSLARTPGIWISNNTNYELTPKDFLESHVRTDHRRVLLYIFTSDIFADLQKACADDFFWNVL